MSGRTIQQKECAASARAPTPHQVQALQGQSQSEHPHEEPNVGHDIGSIRIHSNSTDPMLSETKSRAPTLGPILSEPGEVKSSDASNASELLANALGDTSTQDPSSLVRGGVPFSGQVRESFERRFGRDFSSVRIHKDADSHRANANLHSQAFTFGEHIWLGTVAHSSSLLAHELTHVIQQTNPPQKIQGGDPALGSQLGPNHSARPDSQPFSFSNRDSLDHNLDSDELQANIAERGGIPTFAIRAVPRRVLRMKGGTGSSPPMTPAPSAQRNVEIMITVEKQMTPHEFAVRAYMQAFRMPADVAEQRVSAIEAQGKRAGIGPHFDRGVRPDEVRKPLRLNYPLPSLSEAEQEDVKGRAEQLALLTPEQRSAVDEETDERYWKQTGTSKGTKLSRTASSDLHNRIHWMRTRDEVMQDRNKIAALPARTKELLLPGDKQPSPEQYATVLRIANKLDQFGEDDWRLYKRRINASTSDFATFEESVDRFRKRQQSENAMNHRIQGMAALYKAYRTARDAPKPFAGVGGGVSSAQLPGYDERYHKAQDDYAAALKVNGFNDDAEFQAAVTEWIRLFRSRAVELTLLALHASEQVVSTELTRYQDRSKVTALHDATASMRKLDSEASSADRRTLPTMAQVYSSGRVPKTPDQLAAATEAKEKRAAAESERAKLAEDYPILKDSRLHTYLLNTSDSSEFGRRLREDASNRLADITKTRSRVLTDPEVIYQFDRIRELTLQELDQASGEAVGRLIVEDYMKSISHDELLRGLAIGALAIGLGLLTFGTGTVAVVGAAGALTLSVYSASEEWEKFDNASSAAHTAFDANMSVSSQDPTILWLAVSLVAIGLDGAALVKALKAAAPAAKVFAETGNAAKFEETLAKATELSEGVQKALNKQAKAEEAFTNAANDIASFTRSRLYSGLDGIYLAKVTKSAYYAAAEGIRDFQVFIAKLKLQKFIRAVDFEKLTAAELEALENAFKEGVKKFELSVPPHTVEIPFASGAKQATFGPKGELLLDGKIISPGGARHTEVFKQLGLTHAYKGHGAGRDVLTIANEALQNATKANGAGMSGVFASDQAMLRSLGEAREAIVAGKGVKQGNKILFDLVATPNTGRIFVAKSKLPVGVTPLRDTPFAALPEVAELQVTHVRAIFTESSPGKFEIFNIFPVFIP